MYNTKSLAEFVRHNDKELHYMVAHMCHGKNVRSIDEIISDVYFRFVVGKVVERYKPELYKSKLSTWLFPTIRNVVISSLKKSNAKWNKYIVPEELAEDCCDDVEIALKYNKVAIEFQNTIDHNRISDEVDGLASELRQFEEMFENHKSNKTYKLTRRRDQSVDPGNYSLLKVYKLIRDGVSCRDLARILGCSDMFVSTMKREIREAMKRYGFEWGLTGSVSSSTPVLELPRRTRKGSNQKSEKKRKLQDWEKKTIEKDFIAHNGDMDGRCSVLKEKFGSEISISQIRGVVSELHRKVKRKELRLRREERYNNEMEAKRELWTTYRSEKYRKYAIKRDKHVKYGGNKMSSV